MQHFHPLVNTESLGQIETGGKSVEFWPD